MIPNRPSSVLVLRESYGARRTEVQLREYGHTPVCIPLFIYKESDSPFPEVTNSFLESAVLVLTSASALRSESIQSLLRQRPHMPVLAVGDYTAEETRKLGAQAVISAGGDRHDVLFYLQTYHAPPARLLWATGAHRKPDFLPHLLALGYTVTVWEVYRMEAILSLPQSMIDILHQENVKAVLHYSRRSAEVLCDLAETVGVLPLISTCHHLCISEDAAEPLRSRGVISCTVAGSPTETALLASLGDP